MYVCMFIGFAGAVAEGLRFNFCGTGGVGFIGNFQSWGWSGVGLNLTVAGGSGAILLTPCRSLLHEDRTFYIA